MLVFFKQNLVFFSVPKTGTTAYETALRRRADLVFSKRTKHTTVGKFHNRIAPFLRKNYDLTPERMAVIRDPIDRLRSWYKYRKPTRMGDNPRNTGGLSFDEFVLDALSDTPVAAAGVGNQFTFLSIKGGDVPVHYLFAYEKQPLIHGFLAERFEQDVRLKPRNVSPDAPAPISDEVAGRLRAARPEEFALYERVIDAGGVLRAYTGS